MGLLIAAAAIVGIVVVVTVLWFLGLAAYDTYQARKLKRSASWGERSWDAAQSIGPLPSRLITPKNRAQGKTVSQAGTDTQIVWAAPDHLIGPTFAPEPA